MVLLKDLKSMSSARYKKDNVVNPKQKGNEL